MTTLIPSKNTSSSETQSYQNAQTDKMLTPECLKGKYQFIKPIGEGANAKTYLAVSTTWREQVIVKALKNVDQFKSIELFKREAAALSHINVEGVPKFYDFITAEDNLGECYIVQEYFNFPTLQDLINHNNENNKTFSESETQHIITEIAKILDRLQSDYTPPIIHRDIKPSNILYDPKTQKVMLIDFGAVANPAKKSQGSTVAGTLGFMAPEQLMGECTIQSDYYALGATALYMLTGISPVDMENDPDNPFQVIAKPHLIDKGISKNTQTFICYLMSSDLASRPQNSKDLMEQVDNLQTSQYQGMLNKRGLVKREKRNTQRNTQNIKFNSPLTLLNLPKSGEFYFVFFFMYFILIMIPAYSHIGIFGEVYQILFDTIILQAFHHLDWSHPLKLTLGMSLYILYPLIYFPIFSFIYPIPITFINIFLISRKSFKASTNHKFIEISYITSAENKNLDKRFTLQSAKSVIRNSRPATIPFSSKTHEMKICKSFIRDCISYKECIYSHKGEWFYYIGNVKPGDIIELRFLNDPTNTIYYEVVE